MLKRSFLTLIVVTMVFVSASAQEISEPVSTEIAEHIQVNYKGVQFEFDSLLAQSVAVLENPETIGDVQVALPAYTQFSFDGYGEGDYLSYAPQPQLNIFAIESFGDYPELIGELDALNAILAERPDLNRYVVADTSGQDLSLPMLPPFRATQVFRVQPAYIEVDGIRGIRYLAYYSQSVDPIIEGSVFYTFQGITSDGQYYVSLVLPVNTGVLPSELAPVEDYDAFAETYETYLTETLQSLAPLSSADFTPALYTLDAIAQSVRVER